MTPERFTRMKAALLHRQTTLTVLMENVHKSHNYSAVLRSCDAVGIQDVHAVSTNLLVATHAESSASAAKWVDVTVHSDIAHACSVLHHKGFCIAAANFAPDAIDYRAFDYTQPVAILLGAERDGVTASAAELADVHIVIPMRGLIQSLNVSVACAVILFEAQRQRQSAGLYDRCHLPEARFKRLLFEWSYPELAAYCRRRSLPYPALTDNGEMIGDFRNRGGQKEE